MAIEIPLYMQGNGEGSPDPDAAPYPAHWDRNLLRFYNEGILAIPGSSNDLKVTATGTTLSVTAGRAIIEGDVLPDQRPYLFTSTATEAINMPTPPVAGTYHALLVARAYDPQVGDSGSPRGELEVVEGVAGGGLPAVPTTALVLAEIGPYTEATTDFSGLIFEPRTIARLRYELVDSAVIADGAITNVKIAAGLDAGKLTTGTLPIARIADNAISNSKLRDSVGLSVIGRATSGTGNPGDIVAENNGDVLRRSGTTVGFGQIVAAGITDGTITNAKFATPVGGTLNGGSVHYRRQGGIVHCYGFVTSAAALAGLTLPVGYRPSAAFEAACGFTGGTAPSFSCGPILFYTDGTIQSTAAASFTGVNRIYWSVSFMAA